jgi:DNA topoisomerase II
VAQLVGYIAEHAAYHHGEQSLTMTIVNLAQDYVGSNNVNLLLPNGQYGTRDQGGKDHASARYIFTEVSPITRAIFHPADDPLFTYLKDDNDPIEPEYYVPVVPLVLVNGAEGIGTGMFISFLKRTPVNRAPYRLEHVYSFLQPCRHCRESASSHERRGNGSNGSVVAWLQRNGQEDG